MIVLKKDIIDKEEICLFLGSLDEYKGLMHSDSYEIIQLPGNLQFVSIFYTSTKKGEKEAEENIEFLLKNGLVALIRYDDFNGYGIPVKKV